MLLGDTRIDTHVMLSAGSTEYELRARASEIDVAWGVLASQARMKWAYWQLLILIGMARAGASASVIGARVGKSRNAVLGKASRLRNAQVSVPLAGIRLDSLHHDSRTRNGANTFKARKARNAQARKNAMLLGPPPHDGPPGPAYEYVPTMHPDDAAIPIEKRKTLAQLTDANCRWPVGEREDEGGVKFCPHTHVPGLPYCTLHISRAYPNVLENKKHSATVLHAMRVAQAEKVDA